MQSEVKTGVIRCSECMFENQECTSKRESNNMHVVQTVDASSAHRARMMKHRASL
jgi:hypothetical protein